MDAIHYGLDPTRWTGWLGGRSFLNVHLHTVVPDGLFDLEGDGPARFVAVRCPSDGELTAILTRFIRRAAKVLARFDDEAETEADVLAALQGCVRFTGTLDPKK